MPHRCIGCLTTLMPGATACHKCGRPAPPKSALTEQKNIDATQFISLPPGALLPEEPPPAPVAPPAEASRPLVLAVALGLLAGALLLFVVISLTHARH